MTDVSVVTPSYNQVDFIEDTIVSVQAQTHDSVEHVVIDGESDDGTLDVLRSYEQVDWVSEPDRGQAHALNKGFDRAEGDIVGWLNADDPYVYQDVVTDVVDAFDRTGADVLYGHAVTIDADNVLRRVHYLPPFDADRLRRHCYIVQPSVFLRSHVLDEVRVNEEREYSMDYELWLDVAEGFDVRRFDRIVAADRNHPDRKIIADAAASAEDTAALRAEHGIGGGRWFRSRQLIDGVELRLRRIRALPMLWRLLHTDASRFAFDVEWPGRPELFHTHLVGKKKEL